MNTTIKTTAVRIPAILVASAILVAGLVVAYGVPLAIAPYALPVSLAGAVVAWIEVSLRNDDGSSLSLGGAAIVMLLACLLIGGLCCAGAMTFPSLAPRAPLFTMQYAEISRNLEQSPTPVIRARRNQILAEEARDGALDLRGYLTYFDRVSVDTVERQLGNAG